MSKIYYPHLHPDDPVVKELQEGLPTPEGRRLPCVFKPSFTCYQVTKFNDNFEPKDPTND